MAVPKKFTRLRGNFEDAEAVDQSAIFRAYHRLLWGEYHEVLTSPIAQTCPETTEIIRFIGHLSHIASGSSRHGALLQVQQFLVAPDELPQIVVIDRTGTIRATSGGAGDPRLEDENSLRSLIDSLLREGGPARH
jgi:hypothetical protein